MLSYQEIIVRMVASLVVGLIIGYERSRRQKPAGLRTYALVCIGSTLFMIISAYGMQAVPNLSVLKADSLRMDPGRVAAQIVTGIGFLGAGMIWKERGTVRGLTTAANLWVTAGMGMALGLGLYFLTLVSVTCIFAALYSPTVLCRLGLLRYQDEDQQKKSVVDNY
ncbi:MAG: MgtC/SapB family protein [Thermacetogeniaceae bacterium]